MPETPSESPNRAGFAQPPFIYIGCQAGAEAALKNELAREHPELRFAYSRPGFVTFKRTTRPPLAEDFDLKSVFARCHGFSLGRVEAPEGGAEQLAAEAWKKIENLPIRRWHVWERDARPPGDHGFEPGETEQARQAAQAIAAARPADREEVPLNGVARPGELVADCAIVEPGQWWIGFHRASSVASRWPGGLPSLTKPEGMISRAYLKISEALDWSRLPIKRGEICLEIGSSPGGACQALVDRGFTVIGVDPAAMDERIAGRERFTHIRKRAEDMKLRDFRDVTWLIADSNVAPETTLGIVEPIVTHHSNNIRGLVLTIKLLDWEMAARAPEYFERVRSWGYEYVRARQLASNRQEFCLVALKRRSMRRPSLRRAKDRLLAASSSSQNADRQTPAAVDRSPLDS